jgi:putative ABC transport system ATP-binding protein
MSRSELAVETIDLVKTYRLGNIQVEAVRGVNLSIRKGEFVSIVGPSGSGKSTLLNMIGALDKPTSGHIFIDGVEISKLSEGKIAELRNRKIGFIFQSHNLIARTSVMKNVELPSIVMGVSRRERRRRARNLLKMVGLGDKMSRKPIELSGGEQQRVAIARALINNPALVLGDEPTGNLDSKTGAAIINLMQEINKDYAVTFILTTHNPEVANATERIIHLRDGQIEHIDILPAS